MAKPKEGGGYLLHMGDQATSGAAAAGEQAGLDAQNRQIMSDYIQSIGFPPFEQSTNYISQRSPWDILVKILHPQTTPNHLLIVIHWLKMYPSERHDITGNITGTQDLIPLLELVGDKLEGVDKHDPIPQGERDRVLLDMRMKLDVKYMNSIKLKEIRQPKVLE